MTRSDGCRHLGLANKIVQSDYSTVKPRGDKCHHVFKLPKAFQCLIPKSQETSEESG